MKDVFQSQKSIYFTKQGLEKAKQELEFLRTVKRREIAHRLKAAKELGDLSENAAYKEAKEEQAFNEARISQLRNQIANAIVIDEVENKREVVSLGAKVKVKVNGQEKEFEIVGSVEANPSEGRISNESPLGQALLGKKKGEVVEILTRQGTLKYVILEIF